MPRLDWSPDGARLLACTAGGAIRIHDDVGAVVREIAEAGYLDARWLSGGGIVAIHADGSPRRFTMHGQPYERESPQRRPRDVATASLSARGTEYVAIPSYGEISVRATGEDDAELWRTSFLEKWIPSSGHRSAAISEDGGLVAIGYETARTDAFGVVVSMSRAWLVVDVERWRAERARLERWRSVPEMVLDRCRYEIARIDGASGFGPYIYAPLRFAFDRKARRLAIAAPETDQDGGVIRIGRGKEYPRRSGGGARCVALDDRGRLAAYGFLGGVLRVDYLDPQAKVHAVDVLDSTRLELRCADLVAVAFDRAGQGIACLCADGAVVVAPVP